MEEYWYACEHKNESRLVAMPYLTWTVSRVQINVTYKGPILLYLYLLLAKCPGDITPVRMVGRLT